MKNLEYSTVKCVIFEDDLPRKCMAYFRHHGNSLWQQFNNIIVEEHLLLLNLMIIINDSGFKYDTHAHVLGILFYIFSFLIDGISLFYANLTMLR